MDKKTCQMGKNIYPPTRIYWIDWAKVIAISFVVFGHIPQELGSFPQNYITIFHMPLFFFISGYLTKRERFNKETLKKYWQTLIIPYLCYNVIFYPYWIVKYIIENPGLYWFDIVKPIIGTILFQIESPISVPLNGVTWFISCLLIMKAILSITIRYKLSSLFLFLLCLLSTSLFIANEQHRFFTDLLSNGLFKCFPFFIIGHFCRQKNLIKDYQKKSNLIFLTIAILVSISCYKLWSDNYNILSYGLRFWIICGFAILFIIFLCKNLDDLRLTIIKQLSIGTIVIMGIHWMIIGVSNYAVSKVFHISNIVYPLHIAIILTILFVIILYPLIILFNNKIPFMLGKRKL